MCFFKKTKTPLEVENAKFRVNQTVTFHRRGDLSVGRIYASKLNEDGSIVYDIAIGGECPAVCTNIPESDVRLYIR